MSKYIFTYKKEGIARYISHLDFLRAINRTFRRAGIRVTHSQGFNPHPLLSFALPLALGITSECEAFEAILDETDLSETEIMDRLNYALPDGIVIISVKQTETKNNFADICKAEYIVTPENMPSNKQIELFLSQAEIIMDKKTKKGIKEIDIKQDIYSILIKDNCLHIILSAGNERNIKPMLVLDAMNKYIPEFNSGYCTYHRCKIFVKDDKIC